MEAQRETKTKRERRVRQRERGKGKRGKNRVVRDKDRVAEGSTFSLSVSLFLALLHCSLFRMTIRTFKPR